MVIPLRLFTLATLGSTVVATITTVLGLVRSLSAASADMFTAKFLSGWSCAYSFSIGEKINIVFVV